MPITIDFFLFSNTLLRSTQTHTRVGKIAGDSVCPPPNLM